MNISQPFRRALLWFSWVPFAVAGAVVMYQQEASREVYVSTAKLVVDSMTTAHLGGEKSQGREERMAEFRATEVELLKSEQVKAATLERLSVTGKQKSSADAALEIRPRGDSSSVIELRCFSNDPGYASVYLNELISEYLSLRKKMTESNSGQMVGKIVQEVLHLDKEAKKAAQTLEQLESGDPASLREKEEQRLAALVSELRGEVERLTRAPNSDTKEAESGYVESLKARQAVAEQELRQVVDKNAAIRKTREELDKLTENHANWKKRLIDIETSGLMESPSVSILHFGDFGVRAAPQVLVFMAMGAVAGTVVGLAAMVLLIGGLGMVRRKERPVSALP